MKVGFGLVGWGVFPPKPQFKGPRTQHTKIVFTAATISTTVFYMTKDFLVDFFFRKIFAVLCVVCKGLNSNAQSTVYKVSLTTTSKMSNSCCSLILLAGKVGLKV